MSFVRKRGEYGGVVLLFVNGFIMNRNKRYITYLGLCFGIFFLTKLLSVVPHVFLSLRSFAGVTCFWTSICLLCICIFVEYFYCHRHEYVKNPIESYKQEVSPFYFDIPTSNDMFGRKGYARLLVEKIFASFYVNRSKHIDHSFVIHIGEHYGHGKTSFLMMLGEELNKSKCPVIKMNFEPWLCDTEAGIVSEFFEAFRIKVGEYLPKLDGAIKDYMALLLSSIECEHSGITFKFSPSFGSKRTLKNAHDEIQRELCHIDRPIIITIDDVDRLQNKELMMTLKIIRDTADFPNVFYVVAADNLHLKQMLESLHIFDVETYLKKFFNLEFQLPANENVAFNKLIELLESKFETLNVGRKLVASYISQIKDVTYIKEVFPNMRDVYRFINAYFLSIDSKKNIKELDLFDLFLLTMIQMLNGEYYMLLRDNYLRILEVVRSGNDILLRWREDYNIIQKREEKDALKQIERITEKDINVSKKEKHSEDVVIPAFEQTIDDSQISSNDIIPELMNILFGKNSRNVKENNACRHNMYFKYFANSNASYMVSRMKVVDMLYSDERTYIERLEKEFVLNRDDYFLSEFMYVIPIIHNIKTTQLLKRFFVFIECCYQHKRFIDESYFIKSLAGYEGLQIWTYKLYPVLSIFYGRYQKRGVDKAIIKQLEVDFENFCKNEHDINLLLVVLNIMFNSLGNFIFNRELIKRTSELLVDRFFNEEISCSDGKLGNQEIDTIIQIRLDCFLDKCWMEKFEKYLKENKEVCFDILAKMVEFYNNGKIDWNWHYKKAFLGESILPDDNILVHLIENYPKEKDIFEALLFMHNHFHSLEDVSGLDDNAFIKMAKERNKDNDV